MTHDSGMRILYIVTNGKIDNVSQPTESKRSGNTIIKNYQQPIAKFFGHIIWSTKGKCLGEDALQKNLYFHVYIWKYEFNLFLKPM